MRILCLFLLTLTALPLQAETRYVTDHIRFPLREEPNRSSKQVAIAPSGTKVTVLETDEETKYSKVETEDGKIGYIETRRLVAKPTAKRLLAETRKKLTRLQASPDETTRRLNTLQGEYDSLKIEYDRNATELKTLKDELDSLRRTSANAVQIMEERNVLHKKVEELTREKNELTQSLDNAGSATQQRWFLIGGGVLLFGLILGLILPHLRLRKQRSYLGGF